MLDELTESGQKEIQMIVFRLSNEEYAVPITFIQEIIMRQECTRIPKSPVFVEGVINLRGHIIPIINGRKKFNLSLHDEGLDIKDSRIMVLELAKESVGLIVDSVTEVIHLNVGDIEPPPIESDEDTEFLWGVGKYLDRLLILLNPKKFLSISDNNTVNNITKLTQAIKEAV